MFEARSIWELVEWRAGESPDALMLVDEHDRRITFGDLRERAESTAAGLLALGIAPGDTVAWQLPSRIGTVVLSMALGRLGVVQVPILHLYRQREVGYVVPKTGARHVFVADGFGGFAYADMVREVAPAATVHDVAESLPHGDAASLPPYVVPAVDDVRWIYSTSGTTGDPKLVLHTDATLLAGGRAVADALDPRPPDVGSIAFPFAHIAGPDYLVMVLERGVATVIVEAFNPATTIPVFARNGVTIAGGSTAFYLAFLAAQREQPDDKIIPTLRMISGGGAPMPPEVFFEAQRELGVPVAHGYGMTEVPMITQGRPTDTDDQLAHTVGAPVLGAQMRVVDGEVRVKGPMVCKGYGDPEQTAAAFDDDGWFRTGDLGHVRADGHVVLTGRLKDLIIRKGENISAKEIEDLLYPHPAVGDVAVIGLPDRERGELVCAVVETAPGADAITFEEMVEHLRAAGLMTQKIPERLEVVAELPRGGTLRKVLKHELRARYSS